MLDFVFVPGLGIFEGLLDAFAAGVVLPPVVGTADAIVLDEAIIKRRAAMRTALTDKTIRTTPIAVHHQVFAKYSDSLFRLGVAELPGDRDDVPIASEQLARRSPRPDMGEQFVFFLSEHGSAPFLRIGGEVGAWPLP
jgi:hypothetical protein